MINNKEKIIEYFKSGIKEDKDFRIGIEHEKFLFNTKDNKRIDLRFALIGPGTMWNLLYEGMDQRVNLRSIFRGKDEESVNALIKFGEILKKKNDYDVSIKEDGIEINNIIPINDFENGENWTKLMNRLKLEIIKMI